MMDPVADNEHPSPARRPDVAGAEPAATYPESAAPPPAVRPPTDPVEINPDEIRQFQEFQQFKALMRQQTEQGGQPPAVPPPGQLQPYWGQPPKRPLWQRALRKAGGKLLSFALVALLVIGGALFAIDYFFGAEEVKGPAEERNKGTYQETSFLAKDPYAAVRRVYSDIAYDDAGHACIRFDLKRDIDQRFAENMGGSDCADAVGKLSEEVTDANAYRNSIRPSAYGPQDTEIRISSCDFDVSGGPALGEFTVTKVDDGQWLITDHRREAPCSAGSIAPPSS